MKTLEKISSSAFAFIGLCELVAALSGATHQYVLAGLCAVLALMMWPGEDSNQTIKNH